MSVRFCTYCGAPMEGLTECPRCHRTVSSPEETAGFSPARGQAEEHAENMGEQQAFPGPDQPQNRESAGVQKPAAGPEPPHEEGPAARPYADARQPYGQPPVPPYPPYGQLPAYPYGAVREQPEALSLGRCLGMLLVSGIPVVGFVLLLVWAFDTAGGPNRRTLARAILLVKAIALALTIALWVFLFVVMWSTTFYYY